MAIAVVCGFLVGVFENFVGLIGLFELRFGFGFVFVAVGVKLFRLGAIALLDLIRRGALATPKVS